MRIAFTVWGEPVGWQRAGGGGGRHHFTPKKTRDYEKLVKAACADHMRRWGIGIMEGAVELWVTAYFAVPKGTSRANRAAMLTATIRPTRKPDADNIAKAIKDALNQTAYHDDKQVSDLHVVKRYAETVRVDIILERVSEQASSDQGERQGAPDIRGGAVETGASRATGDPWFASAQLGDPEER